MMQRPSVFAGRAQVLTSELAREESETTTRRSQLAPTPYDRARRKLVPCFDAFYRTALEHIAILSGGKVIAEDLGIKLMVRRAVRSE
jgi:hypothetical protein